MAKKGFNHGFNQWVVGYHFNNYLQVTTSNEMLLLKQGLKSYQTPKCFHFQSSKL
jgi:hypothetical protein